jgi:hypothetical protein
MDHHLNVKTSNNLPSTINHQTPMGNFLSTRPRDDRRWGFLRPQAMVVARSGHGATNQFLSWGWLQCCKLIDGCTVILQTMEIHEKS